MSINKNGRPGARGAALAAMGLLLAQLVAAGQPARIHFANDDEPTKRTPLCLQWDAPTADASGQHAHLTGHLYQRTGAICGPVLSPAPRSADAPRPGKILQAGVLESVANEPIRISYKAQPGYPATGLPGQVITDKTGAFRVQLPAPSLTGGVAVTAAWYGHEGASDQPLLTAEKKLMSHVTVIVGNKHGDVVDPDKQPEGPGGTYIVTGQRVDWRGLPLVGMPPADQQLVQPPASTSGTLAFASQKVSFNQQEHSVTGTQESPGVAAVEVVIGAFRSEPVFLPFGVHARLRRVGPHKEEEIILQRPVGYNGDEGSDQSFFMEEQARLELRLTSLLSGRPLAGMPVDWRTGPAQDASNIQAFLSETVDGERPPGAGITGPDGRVEVPVSARHRDKDLGTKDKPPATLGFRTGTGHVQVEARIKGQFQTVNIPFIDSLYLKTHLQSQDPALFPVMALNQTVQLTMVVDGYVGVGRAVAQRKLVPFRSDDHSVVPHEGDSSASAGPVLFVDVKGGGVLTASDKDGHPARHSHAGFAWRGTQGQLTGYFTARKKGHFCLNRFWRAQEQGVWWNQSGAWLESAPFCGEVR